MNKFAVAALLALSLAAPAVFAQTSEPAPAPAMAPHAGQPAMAKHHPKVATRRVVHRSHHRMTQHRTKKTN